MKIAPKPTPGQKVSLQDLLTRKPTQVVDPQNPANGEEESVDPPPGQFSADIYDGYMIVHNLPIPKYGRFTYRCVAITTTPAYVNNLEEYGNVGNTFADRLKSGKGLIGGAIENLKLWQGKKLPHGFTPASALTLHAYAFNRWIYQLNHGPSNLPELFNDKVLEEGILTNSFIQSRGQGQHDIVEHSDLEVISSTLPGELLAVLREYEEYFLDSRLVSYSDYVRAILDDNNNSPSPIPGMGFGLPTRIAVFRDHPCKNGSLTRIESALGPKERTPKGYVYGVRNVVGCTK